MERGNNKKTKRRILSLFVLMGFTSLVLIGSTYAWFIGINKASIKSFDLTVSSGDQLMLSLDGDNWSSEIDLSDDAIVSSSYDGNSNHLPGEGGLVPISTAGVLSTSNGRLSLFNKTSITSTKGGFRLISNSIDNSESEQDGYLVFDLFVKNGSGVDYIHDYNSLDDEDIYLTDNSVVVSNPSGGDVNDYGIANSVRVAFMQIGRIASSGATTTNITSISCADSTINTGLCNVGDTNEDNGLGKTWNVWEPNDTRHDTTHLTDYFNSICKVRLNNDGVISYGNDSCTELVDNSYVTTYVVNKEITASMNVDVYDGINGLTLSNDYALSTFDTFTDTEKNLNDSERIPIFKLAANSITKVRVYIYLEGQDVDNYDLIANGEKIKINFGFTRDRYDLVDNT